MRAGVSCARWRRGARDVGTHELVWDGTDDDGRRVESGVYLVRADAGHGATTQKVALFK
jgi:flagellar hook assembly protein FlgD